MKQHSREKKTRIWESSKNLTGEVLGALPQRGGEEGGGGGGDVLVAAYFPQTLK